MTWHFVRTLATCLLLTAAGCYEHDSDTPGDAGTRAMRDARPDEHPETPDSAVPDASDTDATADAAQPGDADAAPGDAGEPELPDEDFTDWPEIPDEPMQPPVALPPPSAGACAFEPRPNAPLTVANRKCPDGVVHGSLTLTKASELNALHGCVRVEGNIWVRLEGPSDLNGLQALHVIEGDLVFYGKYYDEGGFHGGNAELTSLKGLENLRCVGGDLRIEQKELKYSQALDLSALRDLVEVGGSLNISIRHPDAKIDTFASLQRVWGDAAANSSFTPPRLQSVYGAWSRVSTDATPPNDVYVGCGANQQPCRDGVLGCAYKADSSTKLAALAKCELALRDLEIPATDVKDLAPLSKLQTVRGRLLIGPLWGQQTPGLLQHLTGLESLKHVGDWLWIGNQPNLQDLHGLSALISAKWIVLEWLGQITDLSGLEHVERAPEELRLLNNDELKTLTGLNFTGSMKSIEIADNAKLTSIAALSSVTGRIEALSLLRLPALLSLEGLSNAVGIGGLSIAECGSLTELTTLAPTVTETGRLTIYRCPKLASLAGLEHLEKAADLSIGENAALTTLDGLEGLTTVGGLGISIRYNAALSQVRALRSLTTYAELNILDNLALPQCEIDWLAARVPHGLSSKNNGPPGTCSP